MQKKRMTAAIVTVILALSSLSVSAEWISAGYDTTDLNSIGKIYNEVIGGKYTSNTRIDKLSEKDIVWKAEGYELSYPHAGYERLYLEGNAQQITRYNNLFPQWETRFADYFWELYGDHRIYQRQQTKIPLVGWKWDFSEDEAIDATLFVPTNRYATALESFEVYGIGQFDLNGNVICNEDVKKMYARFGVDNEIFHIIPGTKEIEAGTFFASANLSRKDDNGHYIVTDEKIAENAGVIVSKFLTGPSYRGDSAKKDVAKEYLKHGDKWLWDEDTLKYGGAKISWTNPTYEMDEPYYMFEYLVINGLVFDGRNDLPRIYRYTGGKATPKIEWKYAFAEAEYPFSVIEFKYIDGKLAYENGEPVYRMPTGEYANSYVKTTDKEIQIWLKDAKSDVMIASVPRTSTTGYYGGYVGGANFVAN